MLPMLMTEETSHFNILIEGSTVLEGTGQVSHRGHIPVADVPIGGGGTGFVWEP